MSSMFCFQCEQTAKGTGCTQRGVCGKTAEVSNAQDELTAALISLARAVKGHTTTPQTDEIMAQGLFVLITNVNFDEESVRQWIARVNAEKAKYSDVEDYSWIRNNFRWLCKHYKGDF